jgi:hypothetical protein
MRVTVLTESLAREVFSEALGGIQNESEVAAELLRHEVNARRRSPRHFLISRVCRLAAPAITLDPELVGDVCEDLERQGDIVLADGGLFYPAPARLVALGGGIFRFVCAVPSVRLFAMVEGEWACSGVRRDCRLRVSAEHAADVLGGVVVTSEVWAGFDRFPAADREWIHALDARLAYAPEPPGSLESDEILEWCGLAFAPRGLQWLPNESARLWRARHRWIGWVYAWTSERRPSVQPFVKLGSDGAARAVYALARSSPHPLQAQLAMSASGSLLGIPTWLPLAEYRYLSLVGSCVKRDGTKSQWSVPLSRIDEALSVLSKRLGVAVVREAEPEQAGDVDASKQKRIGTTFVSSPVYLERLQPLSARAQRILDTYSLSTTADLRNWLSSEESKSVPNFGRRSRAELEDLIARFHTSATDDRVSAAAMNQAPPPDNLHQATVQYGQLGVECLGRLPPRVLRIIEDKSIQTVSQLVTWLRGADVLKTANYGRRTHTDLAARVVELGNYGPTRLVFGRETPPTTAEDLYTNYLAMLDEDARAIFSAYFGDQCTLEEIGRTRIPPV